MWCVTVVGVGRIFIPPRLQYFVYLGFTPCLHRDGTATSEIITRWQHWFCWWFVRVEVSFQTLSFWTIGCEVCGSQWNHLVLTVLGRRVKPSTPTTQLWPWIDLGPSSFRGHRYKHNANGSNWPSATNGVGDVVCWWTNNNNNFLRLSSCLVLLHRDLHGSFTCRWTTNRVPDVRCAILSCVFKKNKQ